MKRIKFTADSQEPAAFPLSYNFLIHVTYTLRKAHACRFNSVCVENVLVLRPSNAVYIVFVINIFALEESHTAGVYIFDIVVATVAVNRL